MIVLSSTRLVLVADTAQFEKNFLGLGLQSKPTLSTLHENVYDAYRISLTSTSKLYARPGLRQGSAVFILPVMNGLKTKRHSEYSLFVGEGVQFSLHGPVHFPNVENNSDSKHHVQDTV